MPLDDTCIPTDETTDEEAAGLPTPLRAARRHCVDCGAGSAQEVRLCTVRECPLFLYRHGRRPTADEIAAVANVSLLPEERPSTVGEFHAEGGSALKAIRRRCLDCSGCSVPDVQGCGEKQGAHNACDLWPFRLGKNPSFGSMSAETRAKIGL